MTFIVPNKVHPILTGETSARKKLQDTIDQLTQDSPTMPDLIGQLKDQGIDVATETASTIQRPRRSGDTEGDQRETKLHQGESQAAQNRDYSQTNPDTQAQQFDRLRQPTIQTQNQESDTQLEDEEVNVAKRVYWLEQSNQVAGQSKQQILYEAESMPTSQFDQMPQIPKQQLADAAPETIATVLPDRNENNWQTVQEYLVGVDAERKSLVKSSFRPFFLNLRYMKKREYTVDRKIE